MKKRRLFSLSLMFLSCVLLAQAPSKISPPTTSLTLNDGWALQSSAKVTEAGDAISSARYTPKGWYTVKRSDDRGGGAW